MILATPADGGAASMGPGDTMPAFPDVASYGGEWKRLADGATVITLAQCGGAATDLAGRAARCALRVRESHAAGTIALATGRCVRRERVDLGEAIDRAGAMLRARADRPRPAIWIDEVTAGLLETRFQTSEGDGGIFRLEGEAATVDPSRPLLGRPTACVGREHELGTLELTLQACIDEGQPRAALVVGLPGMGKSRIRHELMRRVQRRDDGVLAMLSLGDPIRTSSTCALLGGALLRLCGLPTDASGSRNRAAFEERIGARVAAPERARTAVFLGELCGVRYPTDAVPELRTAQQDPRVMSNQIAQAWLTFVRAEAAVQPVLLALDDLQWSDALTIALVERALRELTSSPLMVLALARPEVHELVPGLWAPRLAVQPLGPLGATTATRFARQVLGDRVRDDDVRRIVTLAAGNALYLEELIRAADAGREAIPGTVLAMLQARIGLLPAAARRVLRAASVYGESFPLAGVEVLLRSVSASGELEPCMQVLVRHEMVEEQVDDGGAHRWRSAMC